MWAHYFLFHHCGNYFSLQMSIAYRWYRRLSFKWTKIWTRSVHFATASGSQRLWILHILLHHSMLSVMKRTQPWPVELISHDGKAYNVTLEPGEMALYESHSTFHGRPFPLNGSLYVSSKFFFRSKSSPAVMESVCHMFVGTYIYKI